VGAPLDLPTAWWSPAGRGGWLSLSLPLAEFIAELRASPRLDAREQTLWASAMVESTLDPDVFALPLPRVWPRATPSAPRNGAEGDRLRARRGVHWELEREGEGSYRLTLRGPGTAEPLEIALPLEWRGQVLADWNSDWEGANSRKVLGPRREWRLIRAPQGEGILRYRYTPAQDSVPWR
jgi:hypothetical protein